LSIDDFGKIFSGKEINEGIRKAKSECCICTACGRMALAHSVEQLSASRLTGEPQSFYS
jgi:hypothetical protein